MNNRTIRQQKTARINLLISRPPRVFYQINRINPFAGLCRRNRISKIFKKEAGGEVHTVDWALPLSMEIDQKSALPFLRCPPFLELNKSCYYSLHEKIKEHFNFSLFVLKSLVVYLRCGRHLLFRYAIREKCQRCLLADFSNFYFGGFLRKIYSKVSRNIARVVFTVF